jgi:hypothetical protein
MVIYPGNSTIISHNDQKIAIQHNRAAAVIHNEQLNIE